MSFKLIPDAPPPAPAPQLLTEAQAEAMTETEALSYLASMRYPTLDALRGRLTAMKTSELVGAIAHPDGVAQEMLRLDPEVIGGQAFQLILSAAMLSLCAELDRRIPIPG